MMAGIDLEARLSAYLDLRRSLGMKMDVDARVLESFVRFTRNLGAIEAITSRMVFDWLESGNPAKSKTTNKRLSAVRQFLLYLSADLPDTQVPDVRVLAGYKRPTPFVVFSRGDRNVAKVRGGI